MNQLEQSIEDERKRMKELSTDDKLNNLLDMMKEFMRDNDAAIVRNKRKTA
jgi:hypothetical protein